MLVFGTHRDAGHRTAAAIVEQGAVAGGVAAVAGLGIEQPRALGAERVAGIGAQAVLVLCGAGALGVGGLVAPGTGGQLPLPTTWQATAPLAADASVAPRQHFVALQLAVLPLEAHARDAGGCCGPSAVSCGRPFKPRRQALAGVAGAGVGLQRGDGCTGVVAPAAAPGGAVGVLQLHFGLGAVGVGHAGAAALQHGGLQVPAVATGLHTGVLQAQIGAGIHAGAGLAAAVHRQGEVFTGQGECEAAQPRGAQQVAVVAGAQACADAGGLRRVAGGPGGCQRPLLASLAQALAQRHGQVGALVQGKHQVEGRGGVAAAGQGQGVVELGFGVVGVEQQGALEVVGSLGVALLLYIEVAHARQVTGVVLAAVQALAQGICALRQCGGAVARRLLRGGGAGPPKAGRGHCHCGACAACVRGARCARAPEGAVRGGGISRCGVRHRGGGRKRGGARACRRAKRCPWIAARHRPLARPALHPPGWGERGRRSFRPGG